MAEIKMRTCKDSNDKCEVCGCTKVKALDVFEVLVPCSKGNVTFKLCDACNEQLFVKTLRASCYTNGRLKSQQDIKVIERRSAARFSVSTNISINEAEKDVEDWGDDSDE